MSGRCDCGRCRGDSLDIAGHGIRPLQSAYCGAKHAMEGMTQSIRCELLHHRSKVWITVVQMPAVNTTQFTWCRNKLDSTPQPVPPIYQPEVGARAVYFAAHHRRREIYVGGPTAEAIVSNKLAPGLGDRYLARKGYSGQKINRPRDPNAPDNLFRPVDDVEDHGCHGPFDQRARDGSFELWLAESGPLLLGAGLALLGLGALGSTKRRRRLFG